MILPVEWPANDPGVIIDDDMAWLAQFSWRRRKADGLIYRSHMQKPVKSLLQRRSVVTLSRAIMKLQAEDGSKIKVIRKVNSNDYRRANLKIVHLISNKPSGVPGIRWREKKKIWEVIVGFAKQDHYVGHFKSLRQAKQARTAKLAALRALYPDWPPSRKGQIRKEAAVFEEASRRAKYEKAGA